MITLGDMVFSGSSEICVCNGRAAREHKADIGIYVKGHCILKATKVRDDVLQGLERDIS